MSNQPVLVTAEAAGIGREIAPASAANGAKVFVWDTDVKFWRRWRKRSKAWSHADLLPIDNDVQQAF